MRGRGRGGTLGSRGSRRSGDKVPSGTGSGSARRRESCACAANDPLLDELRHLDVECLQTGKQNLRRGLQRAIKSIKLYPLPITTEAEACTLEGVGRFTARRMLCGLNAGLAAAEIQHDLENIEPHDTHARPTSSSTKPLDCGQQQCGRPLHENENVDNRPPRQLESRHPPNSRVFRQLPVSLGSQLAALGEEEDDTPGILHTPDITPRRPTSRARREEQRGVELRSDPLSTSSPSTEAPSIFSGRWEAVLMVDNREHECMAVQSALLQKDVACETRQLPLGDMLWVARRTDSPAPEVLLGYIVERKTTSDLASSIIDGRYDEQKRRLKLSGLRRRIYLVEGNVCHQSTLAPSALRSALANSQACGGLAVVRCASLRDTIDFLARTHRHISCLLQRSSSHATSNEPWARSAGAGECGSTGGSRGEDDDGSCRSENRDCSSSGGGVGSGTSLLVPAMTYDEYASRCAKHASATTSRQVLGAMVRQAPGCSAARAEAIVRTFKSPLALMLALEHAAEGENDSQSIGADHADIASHGGMVCAEEERIRKGEDLFARLRCSGGAGTNKLPQPLKRVLSRLFLSDRVTIPAESMALPQESEYLHQANDGTHEFTDDCYGIDALSDSSASRWDVVPMSQED